MFYAILCYHPEDVVASWSHDDDAAALARLAAVRKKLSTQGALGPAARLLPTKAAKTLRKDRDPPVVVDGPFAESKEQLLGFYIVDCPDLDGALSVAQQLGRTNAGSAYEVRPIAWLQDREHGAVTEPSRLRSASR
jgi:hypothetical protein